MRNILAILALSLSAFASGPGCSSTAAIAPPTIAPFSGLTGAGTVVASPETANFAATGCFGGALGRVTDANTGSGACTAQSQSGCSGLADDAFFVNEADGQDNQFSTDDSMFFFTGAGGIRYVANFTPSTLATSIRYTNYLNVLLFNNAPQPVFSHVTAKLAYAFGNVAGTSNGMILSSYDLSQSWPTLPTRTTIYNFSTSANCVPNTYTFETDGASVNSTDTSFGTGFSNVATQDTAIYVAEYTTGSGCSAWDTSTAVVTGDYGTTGAVTCQNCTAVGSFTIHNVKCDPSGTYCLVMPATCNTTCYNGGSPYLWQVGTTHAWSFCGTDCSGHWLAGFTGLINDYNNPFYSQKPYTTQTPTSFPASYCAGVTGSFGSHTSWWNNSGSDQQPFFISTTAGASNPVYTFCTASEIISLYPPTNTAQVGTLGRYFHNYGATSTLFPSEFQIMTVSQGHTGQVFAMMTSPMANSSTFVGQLGDTSGNFPCSVLPCRSDVFVGALMQQSSLSVGGSVALGGQLSVQGVPELSITTTTLPGGVVGTVYSQTITTLNGTSPFTFTSSGSLPTGLSLNASTGAITGTPTTVGSYNFVIHVADSSVPVERASQSYSVSITCTALAIRTTSLPGGVTNAAYSFQMQSSGGVTPITWTLASGSFPSGISIASSGLISGTPTVAGTTTAQIQAVDSCSPTPQQVSASFGLTISSPLVITTASVPQATESVSYSAQFAAAGGTSPYTWAVSVGTLPAGLSLSAAGVLSGTPTSAGTVNVTIQVTDSGANVTTQVFPISVACVPLSVTTASLPGGVTGTAYSGQLNSSGGTGAVTWNFVAGSIPPGLNVSASTGLISGIPSQAGTFTVTYQATDSCVPNHQTATAVLSIVIVSQVTITTSPSLPGGVEGQPYSVQMAATGGTLPYAWVGNAPAGLVLSSAGVITGSPTTAGSLSFIITVTDANSLTASGTFTIQVNCPSLSITSTSPLPNATVGQIYSFQFQGTGGIPPYTWGIPPSGISTPPGLGLSPAGVLSGNPTTAGNFTPTIAVNDSCVPTSQQSASNFAITIISQVAITTPSPLPAGTESQSYSQQMTASGGVPPYTWAVTSRNLPTGLSLASGGAITGTPTRSGTTTATIQATDTASHSASGIFSTTISCTALAITTGTTLQGGTQNSAYSQQLQATGGTGSLTWTLIGGILPSGIALSSGGVLSGTPTISGTFAPVIQVGDSCLPSSQTVAQTFSLIIAAATGALAIVTTSPLPPATESQPYSFTVQASGGTPPYAWTTTAGALPAGLSLAGSGAITGTPTASGTATATFKVTDNVAATASKSLSLTVSCVALAITSTSPLTPATVGTAYSNQLAASGGTGALTWSITSGTLPAGLALASSGLISGTPTTAGSKTVTIKATDSCSPTAQTASLAFSITVNKTLAISTGATLPAAKEGLAYSANMAASGGVTPYTWTVISGSLPAGLSLSSAGAITGTATTTGTSTPTIQVTDHAGNIATKAFSLTVSCTALTLTSTSPLTAGTQNAAYSQQLQSTGGTGATSWSLVSGSFPSGVTLSASGLISGTPSASGTFSPVIRVTDSCNPTPQTKQKTFSLTISVQVPTLTITTTSPLPAGTQGVAYSATMGATGGVTPYTWSVTGGSLPTGLSLSSAGAITGTPTTIGTYTATIQVADSAAHTASGSFSITISCVALSILTTSPLPPGTISTAYSDQMQSSGGTGAKTWSLSSGSFPSGVSIASSGLISGTPSASGVFTPTLQVADACSTPQTKTGVFSLSIGATLVIVTTSPLPSGSIGQAYNVTLVATGGTLPYTWSLISGSLPSGLSLSAGGVISGTPTTPATSTFTVQVADSAAHTTQQVFVITTPAHTVSLSWSESTGGVTFNVQRSTVNGGPYAPLATGFAATTYLDVTVLPATTYYYVVSATNSSGTSQNSNQATAVVP